MYASKQLQLRVSDMLRPKTYSTFQRFQSLRVAVTCYSALLIRTEIREISVIIITTSVILYHHHHNAIVAMVQTCPKISKNGRLPLDADSCKKTKIRGVLKRSQV